MLADYQVNLRIVEGIGNIREFGNADDDGAVVVLPQDALDLFAGVITGSPNQKRERRGHAIPQLCR
jgi:hypothetical protein